MKNYLFILGVLISIMLCSASSRAMGDSSGDDKSSRDQLVDFSQCLAEKGWVMYSSFTCSACRAQRELFGPAAKYLKIVECSPHAPDNQSQQCLKMKIRYTPTWLLEKNGTEIKRIKGYKELEELAALTGCGQ
jgi:hypothetical protein